MRRRIVRLAGLLLLAALCRSAVPMASVSVAAVPAAAEMLPEQDGIPEGTAVPEEDGIPEESETERTVFVRPDAPEIPGLRYKESMRLYHADQFSVDYYEGGYKYLSIRDTGDFLLIPEDGKLPETELPEDGKLPDAELPEDGKQPDTELPENGKQPDVKGTEDGKRSGAASGSGYTVLYQPLDSIYLAATSAMDFFDCLEEIDKVTLSCEEAGEWDSDGANKAMEEGGMVYAGKYSAPDYERIVSRGCDLALESTMIYHKPEVKEMLEQFGIPVLVEHSSYESDPLGRSEWIRFYGALLNCEEEADALFAQMEEKVRRVLEQTSGSGDASAGQSLEGQHSEGESPEGKSLEKKSPGKLVAFFNINQQGLVTVRKAKDYVPAMIELAGGSYVFSDLYGEEENALSTVNLQMEEFYARAKDADYLIYNSTIAGAIHSVDELLDKGPLLKDFRAVQEGNVWCTTQSLFQKPTGLADLIVDISRMLSGDRDGDYSYLYHVD